MVRVHQDPPRMLKKKRGIGGLAQLGEHLLCKQGVNGSIPLVSTRLWFDLRASLERAKFLIQTRSRLKKFFKNLEIK